MKSFIIGSTAEMIYIDTASGNSEFNGQAK